MARPSPERLRLLAKLLQEKGIPASTHQVIARRAGADAPLSFDQARLWFLDQLEPNTCLYNDCITVRLRGGSIDVARFERAFREVVRRHEILRTIFTSVKGEAVQRVLDAVVAGDAGVRSVDLAGLDGPSRERELERILVEEVRAPFRLDRAPLYRATLIRLAENEHEFGLTMHHIISDGASYGVLYSELGQLYEAYGRGAPSPLSELAIQYGDYAAWERAGASEAAIARKLEYWGARFASPVPELRLPFSAPRRHPPRHHGAVHRFPFPSESFQRLQEFCRREQVTSYWVLLAAYFATLHRFTSQEDILVGIPSSRRGKQELEKLIGFFVRTALIRNDLAGNPSFRELLARTKKTALEAHEHEDAPFDRIVQTMRKSGRLQDSPLIQAWFAHLRDMIPALELGGCTSSYRILDGRNARFDVCLILDESASGISAYVEYDADLFVPETIARISEQYLAVLRQVCGHPDTTLALLCETLAGSERLGAAAPRRDARFSALKKLAKRPAESSAAEETP